MAWRRCNDQAHVGRALRHGRESATDSAWAADLQVEAARDHGAGERGRETARWLPEAACPVAAQHYGRACHRRACGVHGAAAATMAVGEPCPPQPMAQAAAAAAASPHHRLPVEARGAEEVWPPPVVPLKHSCPARTQVRVAPGMIHSQPRL